jgi:hypothetical protein
MLWNGVLVVCWHITMVQKIDWDLMRHSKTRFKNDRLHTARLAAGLYVYEEGAILYLATDGSTVYGSIA